MSESEFNESVKFLTTSPDAKALKVDTKTKLKLYGLFKQATVGPNNTPKPSFTKITDSYKWKAWTACGNMTNADARAAYVDAVRKLRAANSSKL